MTDPDVHAVVVGLRRWEQEIERLLRQSGRAELLSGEARATLERLDRTLTQLERQVGRARA